LGVGVPAAALHGTISRLNMRFPLVETSARIAASGRFQGFIFGVIVLNAVVLGLDTYAAIDEEAGTLLNTVNDACLGIFVVELAIRIAAYGGRPQDFFRNGWNVFDFVVITAAFAPGLRENATLLRLVRLLRILRIVSVLPEVRVLIRGMLRSIPPIGSMAVLAILLIYLYGMVGWILFHSDDPRHWGNIGDAMLSLFVMLTLEQWPEYLERGMDIHSWSWIYFVSYVLVAGFLLINIVIAIVINAMEGARREERAAARTVRRELLAAESEHEAALAEHEAAQAEHEELADLVQALRDTIDDLEDRLGGDGQVSDESRNREGP
jgi:voltage-gated sodium channel